MDDGEDYVPINVDILRDTGRAVHVRCADGLPRWVPKSVIFGPDEKAIPKLIGQLAEIKVFRWFVKKNVIPIARKSAP